MKTFHIGIKAHTRLNIHGSSNTRNIVNIAKHRIILNNIKLFNIVYMKKTSTFLYLYESVQKHNNRLNIHISSKCN